MEEDFQVSKCGDTANSSEHSRHGLQSELAATGETPDPGSGATRQAGIRQHYGQWYVIYRDSSVGRGSLIWEPCGKRRALAEQRKREVECMLEEGRSPARELLPFSEAWKRWMRNQAAVPGSSRVMRHG